jgi:mannosyltransferase
VPPVISAASEQKPAPAAKSRAGVAAAVAVGAVLLAAVVLRFTVRSDLWLDEALSVNIARLPLSKLPEALKHDGAPPVYYLLLHFWMEVFGQGDTAVRALSGVISIATFPALYFAGRRLGGRFGAWAAVLVFATSPFAIRYATETRMYALVMFLVAWGYLAVLRALERPSPGRCALVALVVAMLLYTHNWSYYLLATVAVVLLLRAWRGRTPGERRGAWRVIVAMVIGGLCYVPWLPVVSYQLAHTGTPWGDARLPWSSFAGFIRQFSGIGQPGQGELVSYYYYYAAMTIMLPFLALFGAAAGRLHIDLDLRTRPLVRWEMVVGVGTIVLGLVASYVTGTAFDGRYASVGVPLVLLCMAMGVTVFGSPPVRVGMLAIVVALGIVGCVRNARDERTQAGQVAAKLAARAKPGEVVVYCPDQLGPAVSRVLGGHRGLEEVTFPALSGPRRVNWVDYRKRIDATSTAKVAAEILARSDGAPIWYVVAPGYRSFEGRCEKLATALSTARPGSVERVARDPSKYFESMALIEYPAG